MVDAAAGPMTPCTNHYRKPLSQMEGFYADECAFRELLETAGDIITYEVYEYARSDSTGDVVFGTSILYPGKVAREYFMTKGHSHAKADRAEIYLCLSGEGLMLMECPDGRTEALPMTPNGVVYVPPYWKHRSVNTGEGKMVSLFAYPADAGHEYGRIQEFGMRKIVVEANGKPVLEDNPRYGG